MTKSTDAGPELGRYAQTGAGLAVTDVLRIAHEDAQVAYRDLSGFKIT